MSPKLERACEYDIAIAGAGLIGLTLALELERRGASIVVIDAAQAMRQTSSAAAGMLAVDDPHNPPALHALSQYSRLLYPRLLARLESLSGLTIPFQTVTTVQYLADGRAIRLAENSLDPRQLAAAVLASVRSTRIVLHEDAGQIEVSEHSGSIRLRPANGPDISAGRLIHASGAWFSCSPSCSPSSSPARRAAVTPRKGQMLRVRIPSGLELNEVHRSETLYIVPRIYGPQAGSAVIGATDEDAGFDLSIHQPDLDQLRAHAAQLVPALSSAVDAPQLEAWAGLRPCTANLLPLLGPLSATLRQWAAAGHYRNGILLAPATAAVIADALEGKQPDVDLSPFNPARFP